MTSPIPLATPVAFVASKTDEAQKALADLRARYAEVPIEQAQVIVALGGDGFMLRTLHRHMAFNRPVYGMKLGTVGFLMNQYGPDEFGAVLRARCRRCSSRW